MQGYHSSLVETALPFVSSQRTSQVWLSFCAPRKASLGNTVHIAFLVLESFSADSELKHEFLHSSCIGALSSSEARLYVLNSLQKTPVCQLLCFPHQCSPSSLAVCPVLNPALPTAWCLLHNSWLRDLKYLTSAANLRKERSLYLSL